MRKEVVNVVVIVWASLYLLARNLIHAVHLACKEMEPYIGVVSLVQMAAFISVSIIGFGLLGAFIAMVK